jgi:hypothetical protein
VADNEHPQRRDLEPRSAHPPGPAGPGPVDPEQYAQFEQFQQYQQFLKYQETQGGPPALLPPGKKPPLWKKILFSKGIRKLAFAVVVVLAVVWAFNHYFGPPPDDGLGVQGQAGPGQRTDPGKASVSPGAAVDTLYRLASQGKKPDFDGKSDFATDACALFDAQGRAEFVRDFGGDTSRGFEGPDCPTIVRAMDGKVGVLQVKPSVDLVGKKVIELSSCRDLRLKPGTPGLGKLTMTPFGDGWIISGHEAEPEPCPAPTTTTSAPTTSSSTPPSTR